jgi:hypothetical protein
MHSVIVRLKNGTKRTFQINNRAVLLFEQDEDGKLVNVYESTRNHGDADYVEIDVIVGNAE